jgi:hypothetical protein
MLGDRSVHSSTESGSILGECLRGCRGEQFPALLARGVCQRAGKVSSGIHDGSPGDCDERIIGTSGLPDQRHRGLICMSKKNE